MEVNGSRWICTNKVVFAQIDGHSWYDDNEQPNFGHSCGHSFRKYPLWTHSIVSMRYVVRIRVKQFELVKKAFGSSLSGNMKVVCLVEPLDFPKDFPYFQRSNTWFPGNCAQSTFAGLSCEMMRNVQELQRIMTFNQSSHLVAPPQAPLRSVSQVTGSPCRTNANLETLCPSHPSRI